MTKTRRTELKEYLKLMDAWFMEQEAILANCRSAVGRCKDDMAALRIQIKSNMVQARYHEKRLAGVRDDVKKVKSELSGAKPAKLTAK